MAGIPKPMGQIKQLWQLHQQGKSIKSIAGFLSQTLPLKSTTAPLSGFRNLPKCSP